MTVSERQLEENEAKLDNVLHKILVCAKQIGELRESINLHATPSYNEPTLRAIETLTLTIEELAQLADILDRQDEEITKELEVDVRTALDDAIEKILSARNEMR